MACAVVGCERPGPFVRGWCNAHYLKQRRYGDPLHVARPSAPSGHKVCCACKQTLPLSAFNRWSVAKDGYQPACRDCTNATKRRRWHERGDENRAKARAMYPGAVQARMSAAAKKSWAERNPEEALASQRAGHLRRKFGMTSAEYEALWQSQGGVCAVCDEPERDTDPRTKRLRLLAVDHCHVTGRVRGLLCRRCNTALGLLGDDVQRVIRVVDYLRR